jgi:hypothetical protein
MTFGMTRLPSFAAIALGLSLSACAGTTGGYPSLAPREIEKTAKTAVDEPPPAPRVLAPSRPERVDRIRGLVAKAQSSTARFAKAGSESGGAVLRGGAAGSDSWVLAQMALSRIEATRFPVTEALSGLDNIRRELLNEGLSEDDAIIDDAVKAVEAINTAQQQEINRLSARLRSR